jgi:hypothetical protein
VRTNIEGISAELAKLPEDGTSEYDHYFHGHPREANGSARINSVPHPVNLRQDSSFLLTPWKVVPICPSGLRYLNGPRFGGSTNPFVLTSHFDTSGPR